MSWHDDVRKEREEFQRQRDTLDKKNEDQTKFLQEFWNKLLEENSKLSADLKLNVIRVQGGEFIGNRQGLLFRLSPPQIEYCILNQQGNSITIQRQSDFSIFYINWFNGNLEAHGVHPYSHDPTGEKLVTYKLAEKDIQVILRNLCSNADIWKGLKFKGGGCFIATAACGTDSAFEVIILRSFRDSYLLFSRPGRIFVAIYYFFSPPVAHIISKYPLARYLTRMLLIKPLCSIVNNIYLGRRLQGPL